MQLTIKGTPNTNPIYSWGSIQPDVSKDYHSLIKEHYVDPLFNNIQLFDNGTQISADNIATAYQELWLNNKIDPTMDEELREIYNKISPFQMSDENTIEDLFSLQALYTSQLPHPSNDKKRLVLYTIEDDIIPFAHQLVTKWNDGSKSMFFASLYGYTKTRHFENVMFVGIRNTSAWDIYKQDVAQLSANTGNPDTSFKNGQFQTFDLAHTISQSILLQENTSPDSFDHILLQALYNTQSTGDIVPFPVNTRAQIMPSMIVFFNMEKLANANPVEVTNDLTAIATASRMAIHMKMVKTSRLMTAQTISPQKTPSSQSSKKGDMARRLDGRLSKKPLNKQNQLKKIIATVKKHETQQQSLNTYKTENKTFMRANRRDPFNMNLMGKSTKIAYRPDIHLMLDTSGSISEYNLKDSVINLIYVAKKMNVDIYVSFFSHYISKPFKLKVKDRTVSQIYKDYLKLPKVSGGTDFEQFWDQTNLIDKMNQKQGKSYRLTFIVTDFEYRVPRDRTFMPNEAAVQHTFYVPIATSNYSYLRKEAMYFAKAMLEKGVDLSTKLIM